MQNTKTYPAAWYSRLLIQLFRVFVKRLMPPRWFRRAIPSESERAAKTGLLNIEIVSHCWQYGNMLTYQLSSFVNYPPQNAQLTVTVFYSEEDTETRDTIEFFSALETKNVKWNPQPISKPKLFRRAIGRNRAALDTKADWVWYTDCDIIFHNGCIDSLARALQSKKGALYFPKQERKTPMLAESDPMLKKGRKPQLVDIQADEFTLHPIEKAKGAFQIVNGDVARAIGYCDGMRAFQTEVEHWSKTYEDTAFRWLLQTSGEAIDIDSVYQIRHIIKGRYKKGSSISRLRSKIRRMQE
ncbi:glycosyltransferase family 2 protein [Aliikangiella marina]|uniref:Glycosyltransferase family 2 protein n=1 Tax=Aliikangiella marina TaxID=1712262 RepID=A0A545TCB0_9GAMM|nr:glycosyltransferase family 2 protein [Aliikangiella marina]TQV74857.1 glycosyltransferase family 2 protein [Aliikangiella marina]